MIQLGPKVSTINQNSYAQYFGGPVDPLSLAGIVGPSGPVKLYREDGTTIAGYNPFIIRPLDNVSVPRDITRDGRKIECSWPLNAGSKYQQWCSEKEAIDYYAMRPIITSETYNLWLVKLFKTVAPSSSTSSLNVKWMSIFCENSLDQLMNYIMIKIAEAVQKIPEMQKNGSWQYEQFNWTDADVYQFIDDNGNAYYNILFNLYNPLRSVGTYVECTLLIADPITIVYMGFVNNDQPSTIVAAYPAPSKSDRIVLSGTSGTNSPNSDNGTSGVGWLYANTLLDQKFNEYGFYNTDNNIQISPVGVSQSTLAKIKQISGVAPEYLLPAGKVNYTGTFKNYNTDTIEFIANNGIPQTVQDNTVIYNSPLELVRDNGNLVQKNQFTGAINKGQSFVPNSFPIGIIN
jgi:hypothetical protein